MEYNVPCACGRSLIVRAGDAGTFRSCACGNQIDIPQLSVLRESPAFCIPKAIPIMQSRYHPKNWHVVTWAAVAVWIAVTLWTNVPLDAPSEYAKMSATYTSQTGKPADPRFVRFFRAHGYPVVYRHEIRSNPSARLDYSIAWFFVNVFLCLAATASIIYVSQSVPRFSVRQLMLATACVAVVIVFFQRWLPLLVHAVFPMGPKFHFFAYVGGWGGQFLYLLPLPFALYLAYRKRTRRITNDCTQAADQVH